MKTNTILNKTTKASNRYRLVYEKGHGTGGYGDGADSPQHDYTVVNGVDRGHGYQGYLSVSAALSASWVPAEAKSRLRVILRHKGYGDWLNANARV